MQSGRFQTAVSLVYPPRCLNCGGTVDSDFGLCGPCWRDTPFIGGAICDLCGCQVPGQASDEVIHCDDCMQTPRPWIKGRSALVYDGNARKLVLGLKHGDRQEIATPAARWMALALRGVDLTDMLIAPVPLHWLRLLKRRYNQSALLAQAFARYKKMPVCPDLLLRTRRTSPMEGKSKEARFATMRDVIQLHGRRRHRIIGRPVLLVDDVMTSGATLAACAEACLKAGSGPVTVVTLARVSKEA